jgi:hypothetical protein
MAGRLPGRRARSTGILCRLRRGTPRWWFLGRVSRSFRLPGSRRTGGSRPPPAFRRLRPPRQPMSGPLSLPRVTGRRLRRIRTRLRPPTSARLCRTAGTRRRPRCGPDTGTWTRTRLRRSPPVLPGRQAKLGPTKRPGRGSRRPGMESRACPAILVWLRPLRRGRMARVRGAGLTRCRPGNGRLRLGGVRRVGLSLVRIRLPVRSRPWRALRRSDRRRLGHPRRSGLGGRGPAPDIRVRQPAEAAGRPRRTRPRIARRLRRRLQIWGMPVRRTARRSQVRRAKRGRCRRAPPPGSRLPRHRRSPTRAHHLRPLPPGSRTPRHRKLPTPAHHPRPLPPDSRTPIRAPAGQASHSRRRPGTPECRAPRGLRTPEHKTPTRWRHRTPDGRSPPPRRRSARRRTVPVGRPARPGLSCRFFRSTVACRRERVRTGARTAGRGGVRGRPLGGRCRSAIRCRSFLPGRGERPGGPSRRRRPG